MRRLFVLILLLPLIVSCELFSGLVHDDQVVAKVGKAKLYKSEIEELIPDIISSEDSLNLASRYIQLWAMDRLYAQVAENQLSKSEMDISEEMEAYRMSLIKYRYEQRYVQDRLDTLVTNEQIQNYYSEHSADFRLSRPLLKVRFVQIMKDSPQKEAILKLMSSNGFEQLQNLDTLARASALRYFDHSDSWTDAQELAKAFGIGYVEMLSAIKDDMIVIEPQGRDDLLAAYVCDIQKEGLAPLEYCRQSIRDILISNRKNQLIHNLEQDLLNNALKSKQFVIYNDEQ